MASNRREKKFRQTYPGPNSADNQQMLQDIKDTLDNHQRAQIASVAASSGSTTAAQQSERERSLGLAATTTSSGSASSGGSDTMRTTDSHHATATAAAGRDMSRRSSPPSDREAHGAVNASSGSPSTTQRASAQNRATPTKQLASSASDWNKQTMKEIKKQLRPFASSDPGFHPARDRVNKKLLMQLINYGYNEVRLGALAAPPTKTKRCHCNKNEREREREGFEYRAAFNMPYRPRLLYTKAVL